MTARQWVIAASVVVAMAGGTVIGNAVLYWPDVCSSTENTFLRWLYDCQDSSGGGGSGAK